MKIIENNCKTENTAILEGGRTPGRMGRFFRRERQEGRVLFDSNDVFFVKASFTVEGSFVISILILLGYDVFNQALGFVDTVKCKDYDGIRTFRLIAAGRNFTDALKGGA